MHAGPFPVRQQAQCPSHHGHHICHACITDKHLFLERPFFAFHEHCDDQLWTYRNLPADLQICADRIGTTTVEWRKEHRCSGQQACNFFSMPDGTCANRDCSNFTCPSCGASDHLLPVPCSLSLDAATPGSDTTIARRPAPADVPLQSQAPVTAPATTPPSPEITPSTQATYVDPPMECYHNWERFRGTIQEEWGCDVCMQPRRYQAWVCLTCSAEICGRCQKIGLVPKEALLR